MNLPANGFRILALTLAVISSAAQVTTSQHNDFRTGAMLHKKILTPQNVNYKQFGKLGAFKVDGAVYAQPVRACRRNSRRRHA